MQKIIGLDIGSYSVKAIEVSNRYKSYEITNYYENIIPHFDDLSPDAVIPATMEQLFRENQIEADRIVTAMPGQYISSRIFSFPFKEPKKIEAAVMAEVEDTLPFHLNEMIVDHQILGQEKGLTRVLAVMTRKTYLASFLEHLQRIDIDPKLVDIDSLSFYNLVQFLPNPNPAASYGIVDLGHEKTSVVFIRDGALRLFRSINLGGRYITEFLARDLETSFNEAQRIKHEISTVASPSLPDTASELSGRDLQLATRMGEACSSISKELSRTFHAYKSWEKEPISTLYLSGGTSRLRHIESLLEQALGCEVKKIDLATTSLQLSDSIASQSDLIAQGVSIGLRAVSSLQLQSRVNLRKGEFAYVQDYAAVFSVIARVSRYVGVTFALMALSYAAHYVIFSRQITEVHALYSREVGDAAPSLRRKLSNPRIPFAVIHRDAKTVIEDQIEGMQLAYSSFHQINRDSGALVALSLISQAIPKDVVAETVEYRYQTKSDGSGQIDLKMETDSFETIAKIQQMLSAVDAFRAVVETSSQNKAGTQDVKIVHLQIEYQPQ